MRPEEQLARDIVDVLRANGHVAYFVGGCVRDKLLGIDCKDFDVATDAPPDRVQKLFPRSEAVGASFGVVLVKSDDAVVETATFRKDFDYRDGRRPERVSFTSSAEEDVQRRDFTINGLLYDPVAGKVIDYVGGQRDLEARDIRAIGEPSERFEEDHLRMLRAVRFAARLAFMIEPKTLGAIIQNADKIKRIAPERIRDELNRILTEGAARRGFELLHETGLLEQILPEVKRLQGVEQPPEYHPEGDVWTHTLLMLEGLPKGVCVTLAIGVLLHDIGKPDTFERGSDRIRFHGHVERGLKIGEQICRRLRYSNAETEQILSLIGNHMKFMHLSEMRPGKLKRFLRQPGFDEQLELHRLDCASSHGKLDNYDFARETLEGLSEEELRPAPLITGTDLIAAGFEPGPRFTEILAAVEEGQLDGTLTARDEALAFVQRRFGPEASQ